MVDTLLSRPLLNFLAAALALTAWAFTMAGPSYAMASPGPAGPEAAPAECYCAECGMRVDAEGPFASQMIFKDGKTAWFCDIGDMLLHYYEGGVKGEVKAAYVRDYSTGEWTDAATAFYLTGSKVRTPMRYGILAFSSLEAAEKFKAESGGDKIASFGEAIASQIWE